MSCGRLEVLCLDVDMFANEMDLLRMNREKGRPILDYLLVS